MTPRLVLLAVLITAVGLAGRPARAADAAAAPADVPAAAPLPAKDHFKVFLLVGQSNMAGRGKVEEQDRKPHPRVLSLDKAGKWVPAVDPIHFDKPTIAGVGLGTTFGRVVADASPGDTVGLVPCAVGGTSIDEWSPDKPDGLYAAAVRRGKLALKDGTPAGVLWHQGEADSSPEKVAAYPAKAAALFAAFRRDLAAPDVPVVVGGIGEFHGGHERINAALQAVAAAVPRCGYVAPTGLTDKGDKTHFDAASYREFGKRYAAKWAELIKAAGAKAG
ncbi:MAG: axe1-6A 1 [Phycisphaerales bacterium]|nr:axe1-6A 1 [Phycisphaerales bacterium]